MSSGTAVQAETRRVSLNLAVKAYDDLQKLCDETHRTMTELIRFGLALAKLYFQETRQGNKLVIATPEGKGIREVVFPD